MYVVVYTCAQVCGRKKEMQTHSPMEPGSITRWLMSSFACVKLAKSPVDRQARNIHAQ